MSSWFFDIGMAIWFGILTSISPCPLATNISAISFISGQIQSKSRILFSGILYMFGRMFAYTLLGILMVSSMQAVPPVANFLQNSMHIFLGPFLILFGIILLNIIPLNLGLGWHWQKWQERIQKWGLGAAFGLGILFALSFCPISAGLFFGSLLGLALKNNSCILMPTLYGIGTALPVLGFAFLLAFFNRFLGQTFKRLTQIEYWSRRVTACIFILAGIYVIVERI